MKLSEVFAANTELAAEWDGTRNQSDPREVNTFSRRKFWWKCAKGHSWQATPEARAELGRGCPYCVGQLVLPGETDLRTRYPEIARRWHPTRNGKLTPERVMPGTHRRCWWLCEKGHEWQVAPTSLVQGSGCPYCAGKRAWAGESDLATTTPELARQWHPTKNGALTPMQVMAGSEKKVWWLCDRGHDYKAHVFSRTQGTDCPYCAGRKVWPGFNDIGTVFPVLASQWHPTLNGELKPSMLTKGSHKQVWWQCAEGHSWKAAVFSRTRKRASGCPVCAGVVRRKGKDEVVGQRPGAVLENRAGISAV